MSAVIPATYEQWRHCIEVDCGIPLKPPFIKTRLAAFDQGRSGEAQRFARLYGDDHLRHVLGWFDRAGREAPQT